MLSEVFTFVNFAGLFRRCKSSLSLNPEHHLSKLIVPAGYLQIKI